MATGNFLCVVTAIGVLLVIVLADSRYNVLRDAAADGDKGKARSYSLGRVQMAFWTILVLAALVKLAAVRGWSIDKMEFDSSLLILIGISGVTGLAAMTVDVQKDNSAADAAATKEAAEQSIKNLQVSLEALHTSAQQSPAAGDAIAKLQGELSAKELVRMQAATVQSRVLRTADISNFFRDILEDDNGNSLHRLQMVFFTLLAGGLFAVGTWR